PGGMQFFFVDDTAASWPTEFGADLDRLADNTNTIRLDHLNVPEARDHFGASVLFTLATLRMNALPGHDVASPRGLIHSHALESRRGGVRRVFNRVSRAYADRAGETVRYP